MSQNSRRSEVFFYQTIVEHAGWQNPTIAYKHVLLIEEKQSLVSYKSDQVSQCFWSQQ